MVFLNIAIDITSGFSNGLIIDIYHDGFHYYPIIQLYPSPMDPWPLSEKVQLTLYINHTPVQLLIRRYGWIHRD